MKSSRSLFALAFMAAALFSAAFSPAANARTETKVNFDLVTEIVAPTVVTSAPGFPRLVYAAGRLGKIRVIQRGRLLPKPLLNIEDQVDTEWIEQGLLGLAFPPDFEKTGRYYVQYTAKNGDNKVDEYQVNPKDPTTTIEGTRRNVIRIPAVAPRGNHNGGPLEFLGNNLFISVGDGNDPGDQQNLAQNLNSLRGKILRIFPKQDETTGRTYQIPASNPFVNKPGRDEVFASGLRNPHSFGFYRPKGGETQMVITDDKPLGTFMPPGRGEQPALNGFGEDEWGRVYAFSDFGEIYRLEQTEVEIKPTRAEIEKWCAEKENKKKPVCVKLNEPTRAERLKKYCSKKKNASKKVCNKKSSKPAKPKQPNQNT